jgi:hypothetical protein
MSGRATGAPASTDRPATDVNAWIWFISTTGVWLAFGVAAIASPGTLTDLWEWVQGLPLAAEIALWIATLPWMLALAVFESSLAEWLRIALIATLAVGWTLASVPRPSRRRAAARAPGTGLRHSH